MIKTNLAVILLLILFINCKEKKVQQESVGINGKDFLVNDSTEINQIDSQATKKFEKKVDHDTTKSNSNGENQNRLNETIYRNSTDLQMFKGFEVISSTIINSKQDKKVLSYLKNSNIHVLALEEIVNSKPKEAMFKLLDTVQYVGDSNEDLTDLIECEKIDDADAELVFAFSEYEDKEYLDKTLKAWKLDLNKNEFNLIDPKKVRCINISYDYAE